MKTACYLVAILLFATANPLLRADDASQKAAAEELLKTMRLEDLFVKQIEQVKLMTGRMTESAAQQSGLNSPEQVAEMKKVQDETLDFVTKQMSWQVLKPEFVDAYAAVFSEAELKDLTAFYQSPVGQKFLDKQPLLNEKIMGISQKHMMEIMPQLHAMTQKRMTEIKARAAASPSVSPSAPVATPGPAAATP